MSADDPTSLETQIQTTVLAEVSMDDSFEEDAFADLSGISEPVADTIIATLSTTGNHPIGTKPRRVVDQTDDFSQTVNETQESKVSNTFFVVLMSILIIIVCLGFFAMLLSS